MEQQRKNPFLFPVLASLTLGLAPFYPEPHIVKQYYNIVNGTFNEPIAWLDLAFHGAPWVWLVVVTLLYFLKPKKSEEKK